MFSAGCSLGPSLRTRTMLSLPRWTPLPTMSPAPSLRYEPCLLLKLHVVNCLPISRYVNAALGCLTSHIHQVCERFVLASFKSLSGSAHHSDMGLPACCSCSAKIDGYVHSHRNFQYLCTRIHLDSMMKQFIHCGKRWAYLHTSLVYMIPYQAVFP